MINEGEPENYPKVHLLTACQSEKEGFDPSKWQSYYFYYLLSLCQLKFRSQNCMHVTQIIMLITSGIRAVSLGP
jgi:hypothetical protein